MKWNVIKRYVIGNTAITVFERVVNKKPQRKVKTKKIA